MKVYQGISGAIYEVADKRLGRGGEGSVHKIENYPEHVAKIFKKNKRDSFREEKLCKMVKCNVTERVFRFTTWPKDVLYDQNGFAGYVMKQVENTSSLSELYSDDKYNLKTRIYAAYNLCAAIEEIHNMGQVCGDLNPRNICINLDRKDEDAYKVTLVDTDSYHFITREKIYRCEVGLAEYLAPEIQKKISGGMTLKNAPLPTFTRETDLFALAVHVFCLLMNGSHPFACAKKANGKTSNTMEQMAGGEVRESVAAPQPIENIKSGFFPFYHKGENIDIPAYAPEFTSLHPNIQRLFVQTFVEGDREPERRVQAAEWLAALKPIIEDFENIKNQCVKGHLYFAHNRSCPYCYVVQKKIAVLKEIEEQNGMPPLPPEQPSGNVSGSGGNGTGGVPWSGGFPLPPLKKKANRNAVVQAIAVILIIVIFVPFLWLILLYLFEEDTFARILDALRYVI